MFDVKLFLITFPQIITFFPKDTLRLGENQIAEVYFENQWTPICGHWFWNNNIGATLFCQELGFNSGVITKKHGNFGCRVQQQWNCKVSTKDT